MARPLPPSALIVAVLSVLLFPGSATSVSASPSSETARASLAPRLAPSECPDFPGADAFVDRIDNRYFPLFPGAIYIYKGSEDGEEQRDVFAVTNETKTILGVHVVVVRDTVTDKHGNLIEDTLDWFAQDEDGNVWYMGEDTKEYENGQVVSTAGSWEAGVNGATPGIIMEAQPRAGDSYKQECFSGEAEDEADIISLNASVKTPLGNFGHALRTRESTPLEPGVAEDKYYAQCVGLIRVVTVQGGNGQNSLVKVKNGPSRTELGCKKQNKHGHKHKHHKHRHHHGS